MSLEKRIRKIEDSAGGKNDFAPTIITLFEDDNKEAILNRLKAKYGDSYKPNIIILISAITRDEARKQRDAFYKEIEDY